MTSIFKIKKKGERKNKQICLFLDKCVNIETYFLSNASSFVKQVSVKVQVHESSNSRKKHFENFLAKITSPKK